MRAEGCAAVGLVENVFNGLTAKGKPSDIVLAQMAEAAAFPNRWSGVGAGDASKVSGDIPGKAELSPHHR